MSTVMYRITGGDYDGAGAASAGLKDMLKKVGAEPVALRRAMIAAYEAETNVVIHARGGEMRVNLDDGVLDVDVVDEGPGIADIELAMKEGYSTAPPLARELGFGAGMGLPNIKRNSDRFQIDSAVGRGTRVHFTIFFAPQAAAGRGESALEVAAAPCHQCMRCLFACPTGALRVRDGRPRVLEHLCVGCGACIAACEAGALGMKGTVDLPARPAGAPLVLPAALLVQFGPRVGPRDVLAALAELGFGEAVVTAPWERALREAVAQYARDEAQAWPVLSPACPAVVSLVEMRFPSLIGSLAPFASPLEAAQQSVAGRGAVVVAGCPAQCSVLARLRGRLGGIAAPRSVAQAVLRLAAGGGKDPAMGRGGAAVGLDEADGVLRITGVRQVIAALEAVENGLLADVPALELWACDQGCFGSPLLREGAAVARWRWQRAALELPHAARAVRRESPFAARRGLRLDEDMGRAIAKLAEMDRLVQSLPGRDCGMCGAPGCRALAEDIVLGRAALAACPHRRASEEDAP